jgi:hypothetical protein
MRFRHLVLAVALGVLPSRFTQAATTTFTVTNQALTAYLFNGANPNGTLTLTRGQTYVFNVTVTGHPFNITTAPGLPLQDFVDPGLTGQGATSLTGPLTFTVPMTGTSSLFYQCGVHTAMTGSINLVAPPAVPAVGWWAMLGLGALVLLVGLVTIRRHRPAR